MHEIWFLSTDKMYLWKNLTKPQADYSRSLRIDIIGGKNVPDVIEEHRKMTEIIDTKDLNAIDPLMRRHLYGGIRRLGNLLFSDEYKSFFTKNGI